MPPDTLNVIEPFGAPLHEAGVELADRFSAAHYVVAQDWTTGDLTCHVTWERGGSWTSIEVGTIAADADADTVPSIKQAADGSLRVAYISGGSVVTKHSNDEGVTWV